jgi:phage-related holin
MIARTLTALFTGFYALAALMLVAIAFGLGGFAVAEIWQALPDAGRFNDRLWSGLARIIIAMAILDVGKYLLEEEVLRDRELRSAAEARKTLTKFMVIVCIAVSLDALVNLTRVQSVDDLPALVYPCGLLLVAVLAMVGLGVYQRLSRDIEQKELPEPAPRGRH